MMDINNGIVEKDRQAISQGLIRLLADTYTLYLKTHNFHWNVEGPLFETLHVLFEKQYLEMALAVDEIAERIRALGFKAPGSYRDFSQATQIAEAPVTPISAEEMLRQLIQDQEIVVRSTRDSFKQAEKASDAPTVDLLTRRMQIHEKNAWMLRSLLS